MSDEPTRADGAEPETVPAPASTATITSIPVPASIPAPKLDRAATRSGLDAVAIVAMLSFVLVGGMLVFGFAQALVPAAEAQLGAACRPLTPTPKSGPIPDVELEDLDGNPVSLADFRGKFLVVNFWATWCLPCAREWPDLDILAERFVDRDDVAVIAISVDQDPALIGPYIERMGLTESGVTILRAKPADAHLLFGSTKIPDTYFIDREGEFEAVFVNIRQWGRAKAVRCVESSL
jgi:peroxiredoxin